MQRFHDLFLFFRNGSEARQLQSRRIRDFGGWAKEYKINPRWIKEGQAGDKDTWIHVWLRTAQLEGREVCIVGASKGICRVCVEAWNAGFKPVLVLLEDLIDEDVKEDVLRAASLLKGCRYRSGLLYTAFEVVVVHSKHVTVRLDPAGQPMDVNVAAPHFCYPFQGQAIVLGNILRHDMLEDVYEKSLDAHHRRVRDETDAVQNPEFWEERRDPECLPYTMVTYGTFITVNIINVFQTMAIVAVYRAHEEDYFGALRALVDLPYRLPCAHSLGLLFGNYLGLEMPKGRMTPYSILMMWIFQLPAMLLMPFKFEGYLVVSDYLCGFMGLQVLVLALVVYAKRFTKLRVTKWSLCWYMVALIGAIGGWATSVPILLIYQLLLATNGIIASMYLTVAFTATEAAFVKFLSFFYAKLVIDKRKDDPTCMEGDQKWTLSITTYMVHAFTETARLASLMSGAIGAKDATFLINATVSLISSTALNAAVRTATVSRFSIRLPLVGQFLCPTSLWAAHNNSKFTMGWGRFFSVFGLMLGRGMIHGHWDIPMTVTEGMYKSWCWSGVVLITVFLSYCSEVIEDMLVFRLTSSGFPFPATKTYEEMMKRRLENPKTATRQHVCHYAIPQLAEPPHPEDEVINRVGPPPALTNQRVADATILVVVTCATSILLMADLSVGVGGGNLMGFCRPLDLSRDSFFLILRNVVLWDMQCDF